MKQASLTLCAFAVFSICITTSALADPPCFGDELADYANDDWDAVKIESMAAIDSGTDCAAFVSASLRHFGFAIDAVYTDGVDLAYGDLPEDTLAYSLFENGFWKSTDAALLQKGDICFTRDGHFKGVSPVVCEYDVSTKANWFPTHTYIFIEWVTPGSTDYAWVVDNQGTRHIRNMTKPGDFDRFAYFMRLGED